MTTSFHIALRYLRSRGRYPFATLMSAIAVGSVGLAVFAFVTVLSLMQGFRHELETKIIGIDFPIMLTSDGAGLPASLIDEVRALHGTAVESIEGEAVLQTVGEGIQSSGVTIRGIESSSFEWLRGVRFEGDLPQDGAGVIGSELADSMVIGDGDKIRLISPFSQLSPDGRLVPVRRQIDVVGRFKSGFFQHDAKLIFLTPLSAQQLLGEQLRRVTYLSFPEVSQSDGLCQVWRSQYPTVICHDWKERHAKLLDALRIERSGMSLVMVMISAIGGIASIGAILIIMMSKRRDIGLLRAMGMRVRDVIEIFLLKGFILGAIGAFSGLCVSGVVLALLTTYPITLPSVYYLDHLPVVWDGWMMASAAGCAVVMTMLASAYPAIMAGRVDAVTVLRSE